jgi:uncharacterized membrane protein
MSGSGIRAPTRSGRRDPPHHAKEEGVEDLLKRQDEIAAMPLVRTVEFPRPFRWLARGWQDLRRAPAASGFYGAALALAGAAVTGLSWERPHLVTALWSGFFLVAPFLLIGVYDLSRRIAAGETPDLGRSVTAWRANADSIGLFGFVLAFLLISWERLSAILFALFYAGEISSVENLASEILFSGAHTNFLIAYLGFGALLAACVFSISVVSVPMLLDRRVDVATAIITSLKAVQGNPAPLALWAALIVVLTAIGFATWFLGLVVILPWLGHATWHAYKDLVQ